ncbi:hypothetical protein D3C76_1758910 [compost metagenome]
MLDDNGLDLCVELSTFIITIRYGHHQRVRLLIEHIGVVPFPVLARDHIQIAIHRIEGAD